MRERAGEQRALGLARLRARRAFRRVRSPASITRASSAALSWRNSRIDARPRQRAARCARPALRNGTAWRRRRRPRRQSPRTAPLASRAAGDQDDRHIGQRAVVAHQPGQLDPAHRRHAQFGEQQVGRRAVQFGDTASPALAQAIDAIARLAQPPRHHRRARSCAVRRSGCAARGDGARGVRFCMAHR